MDDGHYLVSHDGSPLSDPINDFCCVVYLFLVTFIIRSLSHFYNKIIKCLSLLLISLVTFNALYNVCIPNMDEWSLLVPLRCSLFHKFIAWFHANFSNLGLSLIFEHGPGSIGGAFFSVFMHPVQLHY
jgi:hypothetical protein